MDDKIFARIAVEQSFITARELSECMSIQEEMEKMGLKPKALRKIFVEKEYLTEDQVLDIERIRSSFKKKTSVKIAGYEFEALIGKGAMGNVYRARQVSMDRTVAVKVLSPVYSKDERFVKRFLREARAAAKLNHRNIVLGLDVGESNGIYYYAMEYVNGTTSTKMLQKHGPFPEKKVLDIGLQVAKALEHANASNFIHRDVKPDNIMITPDGTAKLCDLGLAKQTTGDSNLTLAGTSLGTPHYISPEQAQGSDNVDIRTDVYSLGASLFHLATGRIPFVGKNPATTMAMHITQPVEAPSKLNPGLSKNFDRLIMKMMEKEPARRPQSPSDLIRDFEAAIEGRAPGKARPAGRPRAATPAHSHSHGSHREKKHEVVVKKSSGVGSLLAFVLLGAIVLVGAVVFLSRRGDKPGETGTAIETTSSRTAAGTARSSGSSLQTGVIREVATADESRLKAIIDGLKKAGDNYGEELKKLRVFMEKSPDKALVAKAAEALEAVAVLQFPGVEEKARELAESGKFVEAIAAAEKFAEDFRGATAAEKGKALAGEFEKALEDKFKVVLEKAGELAENKDYAGAIKLIENTKSWTSSALGKKAKSEIARLEKEKAEYEARVLAEKKKKLVEFLASVDDRYRKCEFQAVKEGLAKIDRAVANDEQDERLATITGEIDMLLEVWNKAALGVKNSKGKKMSFIRKTPPGIYGEITGIDGTAIKINRDGRDETVELSELVPDMVAEFAEAAGEADGEFYVSIGVYMLRTGGETEKTVAYFRRAMEKGATLGMYMDVVMTAEARILIEEADEEYEKKDFLDAAFIYARVLGKFGNASGVDAEKVRNRLNDSLGRSGLTTLFTGDVSIVGEKIRVHYDFDMEASIHDFSKYQWHSKISVKNEWKIDDGALVGDGDDGFIWKGEVKGDCSVEATVRPLHPSPAEFRLRLYSDARGRKGADFCFAYNMQLKSAGGSSVHAITRFRNRDYDPLKIYNPPSAIPSNKSTRVMAVNRGHTLELYVDGKLRASAEDRRTRKGQIALQLAKSRIAFESLTITAELDPFWLKRELRKVKD